MFQVSRIEPHVGENRKRAVVVNLSGYGGVDTDRRLGVSSEAVESVRLEEEDLAKMFAAAAVLMSYIAANHHDIQMGAKA